MKRVVRRAPIFAALLFGVLAACQKGTESKPAAGSAAGSGAVAATGSAAVGDYQDLDSKDILARTETASAVKVKHVLIGWKDLSAAYRGHMDPRAAGRSNADAAKLAQEIYGKLKADPTQIDSLVSQYSEDPGSRTGKPYDVDANSQFVPEFKQLALRLKEGEAGIVKTNYGYHVMERVGAEKPDPLQSNEILARPAGTETVQILPILIGWKDVPGAFDDPPDARAKTRSKEEADKLVTDILAKARGGADFAALMKEFSEDTESAKAGKPIEVEPGADLVPPLGDLCIRLGVDEVGAVKTELGWLIAKRVPPPPPDTLESADILARAPVTDKAQVKHILLGWSDLNGGDPRAQKRTRQELEDLVAKTVARLKKGEKIEPLMKELSEDGGSASSGVAYDASPTASLVTPFKNLSLRLNVGEVGVVKTQFGIHIIQRVQ